jgi:hypothetical protein
MKLPFENFYLTPLEITGAVISIFSAPAPPLRVFMGVPKTPIYCLRAEIPPSNQTHVPQGDGENSQRSLTACTNTHTNARKQHARTHTHFSSPLVPGSGKNTHAYTEYAQTHTPIFLLPVPRLENLRCRIPFCCLHCL